MKLLALLLLVTASPCLAKPKLRDWKTGTLQATAQIEQRLGTMRQGMNLPNYGGYGPQIANGMALDVRLTWVGLLIDGGDYRYIVAYPVRKVRANVTVHGPIKYFFEKGEFYVLDEDGREFKTVVLQKQLLPPSTEK